MDQIIVDRTYFINSQIMEISTLLFILAIIGVGIYWKFEPIEAFASKHWKKIQEKYELKDFDIKEYIHAKSIVTVSFLVFWIAMLVYMAIFVIGGLKGMNPETVKNGQSFTLVVSIIGTVIFLLMYLFDKDFGIDGLGVFALCFWLILGFVYGMFAMFWISWKTSLIWSGIALLSITIATALYRWNEKREKKKKKERKEQERRRSGGW